MKKIVLSLLAGVAIASTSFAGSSYVASSKSYKQEETYVAPLCFQDTEFTLDLFGAYVQTDDNGRGVYTDGWGGGVGLNFFFARYFGIGVDGIWTDTASNSSIIHNVSGSFIIRFPIDTICLAPYVFGGGGGHFDSENNASAHAGAGLEYRATEKIGIFGDGRYTWVDDNAGDFATYRLGVRFVF